MWETLFEKTLQVTEGCVDVTSVPRRRCCISQGSLDIIERSRSAWLDGNSRLCLWNRFFQDKELRAMVQQDVLRTFPEMQYFQQDSVRNMLTDILFCYARENEQLLYKQGKEEMITSIPFARPQDTGPSVAIVAKVNRIQDQLLKKHDIELYMHLNRLEIAPQIYGIRWVRLLFGREFLLQDLLILWDALFADSITLDLVDYIFVAMLLYIRDVLIASNYQTCLGLLMHYPPIGDIHALLHKALFLRDPKNFPRPVNYQFHQNLDYYKTRGADLMNKTRATAKSAPLNINKVSTSLLNFGRKLIAPAISTNPGSIAPGVGDGPAAPHQTLVRSMVEPPLGIQQQQQHQQHRLMKSESMPVHLSKGQSTKNISSSPSIESLPGGREYAASPPLSATKKDSFFNISRSRSHSKTMGKKESDEDLEAQISFLQGQLNDLEAMCKYSAKMMNVHIGKIQEVILQEQLEKEDEVLVALAGLKQIKDILKGSLRFNQSQLEAEENEEITIADDHYCSNSHAAETENNVDQEKSQFVRNQEATSQTSLNSESRSSDDYILLCQEDDDLEDQTIKGPSSIFPGDHPHSHFLRKGKVILKSGEDHKPNPSFSDPLMGPTSASSSTSGSSPDDDSSNSKDSDFTIVNPMDI
ncbi:TBCD5 protein, partial [Polypterus senegalus]